MFAHGSYDALVVGARCAGAATAMLMARAGLRVLVIDRAGYGTDTISTHALMRGGVLQLHRWGVLPRLLEMGTPAVRETTFHYGDEAVTVAIRPANGVEALYAPRRTLLDAPWWTRRAKPVRRCGTAAPLSASPSVPTDESAARRSWMPRATIWRSRRTWSSVRMASVPASRAGRSANRAGRRATLPRWCSATFAAST